MAQKIYVISGGPGTGKTSIIKELEKQKFKILSEVAREVAIQDKRFIGKNIKEINARQFQKAIFDLQKEQYSKIKGEKIIFTDRSFGDTLTYYNVNKIKIPKQKFEYAKKFKVSGVFILDFLDFYEIDDLRIESKKEQERIQNEIIKIYKKLGYKPLIVPFDTIKKRVKFILKQIKDK